MSELGALREFVTKSSFIDLAVAVVIGSAINAVVTSLVSNMITPLIGVPGHFNFQNVNYTVNGSTFMPGLFLNSVISFIVILLVVFFLIVRPVQKIRDRKAAPSPKEPTTKTCPECLSNIPIKARRCAYCTSKVE